MSEVHSSGNASQFWIRFSIPVFVSLAATPVLLCLGVLSGGAGHGNYFLAGILFPFTMLSAFPITTPFILLAVVQFPVYGIILGLANAKRKLIPAALVLLAIHALGIGSLYASSYYAHYKYRHDPNNQLLEAVSNDDVLTAKRLLDEGVDPNFHRASGGPPSLLGLASMHGHLEMAKLLLEKGADVNYRNPFLGGTALFDAVAFGHEQTVQLLLSKGADVTVKDSNGYTVLERAKLSREQGIKRGERKPWEYPAADRARDIRIISLLEAAAKDQKKP